MKFLTSPRTLWQVLFNKSITKSLVLFFFICGLSGMKAQSGSTDTLAVQTSVDSLMRKLPTFEAFTKSTNPKSIKSIYHQNKKINVITINESSEAVKTVRLFYLKGRLIYCETVWADIQTGAQVRDEKLYLIDGDMIVWKNDAGQFIDPATDTFQEMNANLKIFSDKLLATAFK